MKKANNEKIDKLNAQHQKEASIYDKDANWNIVGEMLTKKNLDNINTYLDKNKTFALDIATGTGRVAEIMKNKVKTVIGLDISIDMIKVAQEKGRIDIGVVASAGKTPFLDNSFDLLYCRSAYHYMSDKKTLKEWVRITKNNGWIIIEDSSYENDLLQEWYDKFISLIYLKGTKYLSHNTIIKMYKELGQNKTDFKIRKMQISLNEWLGRKQIGKKAEDKVKDFVENSPVPVKEQLNIQKRKDDYIFDCRWTTTRCLVTK
jgi:ubiquinone/menaquinone biosynthesis C-methylase UbiE